MAIIKSIYWELQDRDELVYKFPFNNVTTGSVLTVNESQEAFFFKSGTLWILLLRGDMSCQVPTSPY